MPDAAFDAAPGRRDWYTPWGAPAAVRSLTASGDALLVNIHVGGILRAGASGGGDGGWTPTVDIDADVHEVVAVPGGDRVVAAAAIGLLESTDGGATWSARTAGLHATYARAVAVAGSTVVLSVSTGPSTRRAGVYRAPFADPDAPFERCTAGLPEWFTSNVDSHCLAATGDMVVFAVDGDVYTSLDAGRRFERAASGLPPARGVVVG